MRDIILGLAPPTAFAKPVYILFAVATSTLLFFIVYINPDIIHSKLKCQYYDRIMLWCDTLGLGIFTVLGVQTASKFVRENMFFFVFIGVLTGVGGGVLRDIMARETPYILVKQIYACASIVGGIVFVLCRRTSMTNMTAMLIGMAVTVIIRSLAAHYDWNLLRIH